VMLSVLTQSIANASLASTFRNSWARSTNALGADLVFRDRARLCGRPPQVDCARLIILATAAVVPLQIHILWMLTFLVLTAVTFSLFASSSDLGRRLRKAADDPDAGGDAADLPRGSFYSVNMLPSGWRTITLLNPVSI